MLARSGRLPLAAALVLATGCASPRAPAPAPISIVPVPRSLEAGTGSLRLGPETAIRVPAGDAELRESAELFATSARAATGLPLPIAEGTDGGAALVLRVDSAAGAEPESYHLSVSPAGALLTAPTHAGLFRGLQTLRQLLPPEPTGGAVSIPAVEIDDAPRFRYRGMHLDVGRHFFPVSFVKRYLDLMALYKFNTFHWHLTEDQGWRIEIKRYPRLTEVGGCRKETQVAKQRNPYVGDGERYCGYYTQDEIRDVVRYAAERHITIVPEIEMPGHSSAALAAYPELGCTPGPFEVQTRWGVFPEIYCPKEETFTFLENVLTEVMDLFPGRYIHIGGDEAPKKAWEESPIAQAVIQREGLKDEHELQSYFIQRMEKFLNQHGRSIIGWDEILEGGLAPNATVMSWRGIEGGIAAAKQGHDVVMTPVKPLYLDYYQGDPKQEPLAIGGYNPIDSVYLYEPVPPELTAEEARHILGAQGNVWTEYMATPDHVEYMVLPRMLALSEVLWSPKEARDLESFRERLPAQLRRLDRLGYHYRVPDVVGLGEDRTVAGESETLDLSVPVANAVIRCTTDGSEPTQDSPECGAGFVVRPTTEGVTVRARAFLPDGRTSDVASVTLKQAP
jgi:hexosaminidase